MNKKTICYILERSYPYLAGIAAFVVCDLLKLNFYKDKNYGDLLNGLITLSSLIIGFIGAVIPVLVSMKNDSAFVKYVFERDKDRLFMKYMKEALLFGLLDVVVSLVMHVRSSLTPKWISVLYFGWIVITVTFLAAAYRSMSHMITLVFNNEEYIKPYTTNRSITKLTEEQKKDLHNEFK